MEQIPVTESQITMETPETPSESPTKNEAERDTALPVRNQAESMAKLWQSKKMMQGGGGTGEEDPSSEPQDTKSATVPNQTTSIENKSNEPLRLNKGEKGHGHSQSAHIKREQKPSLSKYLH